MDLELRHLRCLVAIVDSGTFTDAAIELCRTIENEVDSWRNS